MVSKKKLACNCFETGEVCTKCKKELDRLFKLFSKRTEKQIEAIRQSEILSAEDYNIRVY